MSDLSQQPDSLLALLKYYFKRFPGLYRVLTTVFGGQPMNKSAYKFLNGIPHGKRILNIGSGPKRLRDDVTNVDIEAFSGVDIVASADALPIENASVDAVVCDNLLEHVPDPHAVVREMYRVLRTGGLIYIGAPFMIPFHSSPSDYYRWSKEGLRLLLKDFDEVERKIQYGPTAALTYVLGHWLSILLSFNSKTLYGFWSVVFLVVFAPLKPLDYILVHWYGAEHIALGFYFIGRKPN
jgi:SAM-dependent methyltransferase